MIHSSCACFLFVFNLYTTFCLVYFVINANCELSVTFFSVFFVCFVFLSSDFSYPEFPALACWAAVDRINSLY